MLLDTEERDSFEGRKSRRGLLGLEEGWLL